jgi:hypothetical protein
MNLPLHGWVDYHDVRIGPDNKALFPKIKYAIGVLEHEFMNSFWLQARE